MRGNIGEKGIFLKAQPGGKKKAAVSQQFSIDNSIKANYPFSHMMGKGMNDLQSIISPTIPTTITSMLWYSLPALLKCSGDQQGDGEGTLLKVHAAGFPCGTTSTNNCHSHVVTIFLFFFLYS